MMARSPQILIAVHLNIDDVTTRHSTKGRYTLERTRHNLSIPHSRAHQDQERDADCNRV